MPVLVDCSQRGAHPELMQKYGVRGYPTVIFCDPKGNEVARLGSRSPADVKAQIEQVVAAHTAPAILEVPLEEAKKAAAEQQKLVAAVFVEAPGKLDPKEAALLELILSDEFEAVRGKFVWVKRTLRDAEGGKTEEGRALRASRAPTVVVIDPALEEPADGVVKRFTSFKRFVKELERLLDKRL